jgi:hypothetical protein
VTKSDNRKQTGFHCIKNHPTVFPFFFHGDTGKSHFMDFMDFMILWVNGGH